MRTRIILSFVMLASCVCASGQGIAIYKRNGDVVRMLNAELDSIVAFDSELGGHTAVDLGLSVKWADCNLGADKPEATGDYYAWGDTETKSEFTLLNCRMRDVHRNSLRTRGVTDEHNSLVMRYDAARQLWNGTWRMPTSLEFEELRTKCKWEWRDEAGVSGYRVTGANGNSIFLPAAGFCREAERSGEGEVGYYWSATAYHDYNSAESLFFYSSLVDWYNDHRMMGFPIRAVAE